jgi:hypothetical protein
VVNAILVGRHPGRTSPPTLVADQPAA